MPAIPATKPKTLQEQLTDVEAKLDQADQRLKRRNRIGAVVVVMLGIGIGSLWVQFRDDQSARRGRTVASCTQTNRQFKDYTDDLVAASGGNPNDPVLQSKLEKIRQRDCTKRGLIDYFNHAPPNASCVSDGRVTDGRGYCVTPSSTTSTTR